MSDTSDNSNSSSNSESDNETLQELCNNFSKLKPYDFEPLASSDESEKEDEVTIEDQREPNTNQRKGNKNWCLCGFCKIMENERECWCCHEANEITDDLFKGKIFSIIVMFMNNQKCTI